MHTGLMHTGRAVGKSDFCRHRMVAVQPAATVVSDYSPQTDFAAGPAVHDLATAQLLQHVRAALASPADSTQPLGQARHLLHLLAPAVPAAHAARAAHAAHAAHAGPADKAGHGTASGAENGGVSQSWLSQQIPANNLQLSTAPAARADAAASDAEPQRRAQHVVQSLEQLLWGNLEDRSAQQQQQQQQPAVAELLASILQDYKPGQPLVLMLTV